MQTKIQIETKKTDNHQNYNQKRKTGKKQKKRWIRRPKKVKNTLKDVKVFYQTVRGFKWKLDALDEAFGDYKLIFICLVETHLAKEEEFAIPRYWIYRNDGTKNSNGILTTVRNNVKIISAEISRYGEVGHTLSILLKTTRKRTSVLEPFMNLSGTWHQIMN